MHYKHYNIVHYFFTFFLVSLLSVPNCVAQSGVGTTTPNASAVLDVSSITKGLLPPRMTTAERNLIASPAEGLLIYNTSLKVLDTYNGVRWMNKSSIGATDVYNPVTGQIWMDRNLGATQVATSSTDADAYGYLYQWGRGADGHQLRTSSTTTVQADAPLDGLFIVGQNDWRTTPNDNLWQGVTGTNNPCPSGYRLPTRAEWQSEMDSWSSNNGAGAFASPLKLTLAGFRDFLEGGVYDSGSSGYYWNTTISSNKAGLVNISLTPIIDSTDRAYGLSVRCIKD